jgi:hypothetical protein
MSNPALKPDTVGRPHIRQLPGGRFEAHLLCRNNLGAYRKPKRTGRTEQEAVRQVRKAAAEWIGAKPGSHAVKPTTRLSTLADIWLAETNCAATSPRARSTFTNTSSTVPTAGIRDGGFAHGLRHGTASWV